MVPRLRDGRAAGALDALQLEDGVVGTTDHRPARDSEGYVVSTPVLDAHPTVRADRHGRRNVPEGDLDGPRLGLARESQAHGLATGGVDAQPAVPRLEGASPAAGRHSW